MQDRSHGLHGWSWWSLRVESRPQCQSWLERSQFAPPVTLCHQRPSGCFGLRAVPAVRSPPVKPARSRFASTARSDDVVPTISRPCALSHGAPSGPTADRASWVCTPAGTSSRSDNSDASRFACCPDIRHGRFGRPGADHRSDQVVRVRDGYSEEGGFSPRDLRTRLADRRVSDVIRLRESPASLRHDGGGQAVLECPRIGIALWTAGWSQVVHDSSSLGADHDYCPSLRLQEPEVAVIICHELDRRIEQVRGHRLNEGTCRRA